jgi:hypothetical protein
LSLIDGFADRAYFGICWPVQALEDRQLRPYPDLGADEQGRRLGTAAVRGCGARIFFWAGALNEVSDEIYSLCLHNIILALWQQWECVCARAFCVPKFAVGVVPRELWASFRVIFCAIEV